jgi:hypothetical protein
MKHTTFAIGVIQLGAKGTNATTENQENLGCGQHPKRRRSEIDPNSCQ